ncbi:hypothetical protein K439DRAFT_1623394 [Ramaria rubella]|nr:hypothetical protein K439DRAFT_1623394 [Ramaria rubella]
MKSDAPTFKLFLRAYTVPPYICLPTWKHGWMPDDIGVPAGEVEIDPSHKGEEYFHVIDMAQDSFTWLTTENARDIINLANMNGAYIIYKYGPVPDPPDVTNTTFFEMSVLGMQGYDAAQLLPHDQRHDHLNESLIMHGLLGPMPVHPTLAIPFSIQQWVKVLCDLSNQAINLSQLGRSTTVKPSYGGG